MDSKGELVFSCSYTNIFVDCKTSKRGSRMNNMNLWTATFDQPDHSLSLKVLLVTPIIIIPEDPPAFSFKTNKRNQKKKKKPDRTWAMPHPVSCFQLFVSHKLVQNKTKMLFCLLNNKTLAFGTNLVFCYKLLVRYNKKKKDPFGSSCVNNAGSSVTFRALFIFGNWLHFVKKIKWINPPKIVENVASFQRKRLKYLH